MPIKTIMVATLVAATGLAAMLLLFTAGRGSVIYVPDQAVKHLEMGSFLINKRRHTVDRKEKAELLTKAIQEFKQALELKPDFEVAHNMLGHCYIERGLWKPALKQLNKALELRPDYPAALFNRALVYRKISLGKKEHTLIDKAISDYQTALGLELSAAIAGDLLKALADSYQQKGELEKAVQLYQEYLKRAPHASDAPLVQRKIHGLTLMHKGNTSELKEQTN